MNKTTKLCQRNAWRLYALGMSLALSACANLDTQSQNTPDVPAAITERLRMFYPAYIAWVDGVQMRYKNDGQSLNQDDVLWAQYLGIQNIDKIRVIETSVLPMPDQAFLVDELRKNGWQEEDPTRVMGYFIFIKPEQNTRKIRAYQLALIAQMEKMGYANFLRQQVQQQRMHLDKKNQAFEVQAQKFTHCLPNDKNEIPVLCHVLGQKPPFMPKSLPKYSAKQNTQEPLKIGSPLVVIPSDLTSSPSRVDNLVPNSQVLPSPFLPQTSPISTSIHQTNEANTSKNPPFIKFEKPIEKSLENPKKVDKPSVIYSPKIRQVDIKNIKIDSKNMPTETVIRSYDGR